MRTGSIARQVLRRVVGRITIGSLDVTWSNGTTEQVHGTHLGPHGTVTIHDETGFLRALVGKGSVGLAAAYFDGIWETEDLPTFLEVGARNLDERATRRRRGGWVDRLRGFWDRRPHRMRSDAIREIGDHYNLGNDFYEQWLDETMTYSSALFDSDEEPLAAAQNRKYERLCALLELVPGDRVLEIGCGWGGFAEYAASNHGAHVTGLTLSTEQASYANKRLERAGVSDRTEIRLKDFRDERGMYDKAVSIEMIESVDETLWPPLFHAISRAIPPGGKAAMQAITIDERFYEGLISHTDFIKTYIFPGGALPSLEVLQGLVADAGLAWVSAQSHGLDYARTLHCWAKRFDEAWPRLVSEDRGFDEAFHRMWRYYLAYCEAGFRTGRIDGYQILLERPAAD
ncbi:MAG: cyclopropane-fatty-acyl-phospholipid synthase family protein [Acidimicrobiia bacterium]